jgi:hypothetical protein
MSRERLYDDHTSDRVPNLKSVTRQFFTRTGCTRPRYILNDLFAVGAAADSLWPRTEPTMATMIRATDLSPSTAVRGLPRGWRGPIRSRMKIRPVATSTRLK